MDDEKYAALKQWFKDAMKCEVVEHADGTRGIWKFRVLTNVGLSPIVALTDEFIADNSLQDIRAKLDGRKVAEQAFKNPSKEILVTSEGVQINERR